jgi:hypothetical protein
LGMNRNQIYPHKKIFLENAIMYTGCLLLSWHKQE